MSGQHAHKQLEPRQFVHAVHQKANLGIISMDYQASVGTDVDALLPDLRHVSGFK